MFLEKIACIFGIFIDIWIELVVDIIILWQQEYLLYKRPIRASNILRIIVVHIYTCITGHIDEYTENYLDLCREWDKQENRGSNNFMRDFMYELDVTIDYLLTDPIGWTLTCGAFGASVVAIFVLISLL